jgi:hypothetical protein
MVPLSSEIISPSSCLKGLTEAVLASGLDGTSLTSYSTPVPNVSPNSAIYFLQLYVHAYSLILVYAA